MRHNRRTGHGEAHMQAATALAFDDKLPEVELARRVAAGSHEAFTVLMRRYNQRLYRVARSVLKDDAEAEDAVQEAYLLAYRAIGRFRGDARLSTWLVRIVVNEAVTRLRKRGRSAEVIRLDGDAEPDSEIAEADMDEATPEQPEHAALRAETRRLLESKIDELPDAFRVVFVLRALEERAVGENPAARLAASAIVGLVLRVHDPLHGRAARGAGLAEAAVHRHALAKGGDLLRKFAAGMLPEPLGPFDERRARRSSNGPSGSGSMPAANFRRRSPPFARAWRCTAASASPAPRAARPCSGSCTRRTRPTIALAARRAAGFSPTARSRACSRKAGRARSTSSSDSLGK